MTGRHVRTRSERTRGRTRRQMRASIVAQPDPKRMAAAIAEALAAVRDCEPSEPGVITGAQRMADDATIRELENEAGRTDGLPAEHPESMVLELAPADEVWLAMISDTLWPCDEYQQIVAEDFRQRRDGAA
jgi:hypothetical protein